MHSTLVGAEARHRARIESDQFLPPFPLPRWRVLLMSPEA